MAMFPSRTNQVHLIRCSENGSSLIGILVAVAMLGVLSVTFMTMMNNNIKASKTVELMSEREDLRRYIRVVMSCTKTMGGVANNCSAGTLVNIKKPDDTILIGIATGASRQKIGNYYLQAFCTGRPREFNFRYSESPQDVGNLVFNVPYVCP